MKSDHIERHLVNIVTWMVGGHFLLRLREVNTSEKKSLLKSALKEYFNFWEEAIDSPNRLHITNYTQRNTKCIS